MASEVMPLARAEARVVPARAKALGAARFAFVDNLRILLVALVIVHHLAVTYGGQGGWYYYDGRTDTLTATVLTLFVAVNQSFFMGFYFLLAAYFVPRSLEAKGARRFLKDRCLRLGVPLLFQLLVIAPLLSYGLGVSVWGYRGSLWAYLGEYARNYQGLDTGPLWFVEALLLFSAAYALGWVLARPRARPAQTEGRAPGNGALAAFALAVGLVTFVVRIWLPVGWALAPLGFQIAYFPQYVSLFVAGTVAYRRGWLTALAEDPARGRLWGRIAVGMIALAPALYLAGGALGGDTGPFLGGLHWQAAAYALLEQFLCLGMVIGLMARFRRRHDRQGPLARELSAGAYAVYILHAPILVCVSVALRSAALYPLLKFALASVVSLPLCFLAAGLVRRLPAAERIL